MPMILCRKIIVGDNKGTMTLFDLKTSKFLNTSYLRSNYDLDFCAADK